MDGPQPNGVAVLRFQQAGVEIDNAIEVLTGRHPWALLTLGALTTWTRVLARRGTSVELWSAWTGFTPRKLLATFPLSDLQVTAEGKLYDRLDLGGRYKLRLRRHHRPTLRRWLAQT